MRDSLRKVLKIPAIYAALAAILYNLSGLPYPGAVETYGHYFIGTWVVLGMMIIGIALANEKSLVFNKGFFALLMGIKLILWPFFVWGFVMLDQTLLFLFDRDIYVMLLIFSITPLPSTAVSFAASLDLHTGETSMAVLLSTLLSIIYIPLAFFIFGFM
ncbi:MAG: hypothetical protein CO093_07065 [Alphaproteobacteria bacterium CG_4_9_14_3_um_filter_47_13]|nr:MAG: hypothetical protein CO093_07065 [Alphaproteobacteria bacterium CG_4_9_14_3_um_filter_47_13]